MAQPYREFTLLPEGHARGKVKPERAHMWMQGAKCASQAKKVEAKSTPLQHLQASIPFGTEEEFEA